MPGSGQRSRACVKRLSRWKTRAGAAALAATATTRLARRRAPRAAKLWRRHRRRYMREKRHNRLFNIDRNKERSRDMVREICRRSLFACSQGRRRSLHYWRAGARLRAEQLRRIMLAIANIDAPSAPKRSSGDFRLRRRCRARRGPLRRRSSEYLSAARKRQSPR